MRVGVQPLSKDATMCAMRVGVQPRYSALSLSATLNYASNYAILGYLCSGLEIDSYKVKTNRYSIKKSRE